jgi:arsenite methyltransferase
LSEKEIKDTIREVYTAIAETIPQKQELIEGKDTSDSCSGGCGGDCGSGCSCGGAFDPIEAARQLGYSNEDLEAIPQESVLGLGCGNPVTLASLKPGETVLDLGSGGGIDVFLASRKVGSSGKVIGVDINEAMIKRSIEAASEYGYTNTEFKLGEIEALPIDDDSVDVIVSNCVINLSLDKTRVFHEAYRVLKPGGRLMVSDMVTVGGLPEEVRKNVEAWASCISGAEEKNDYLSHIEEAGFKNVKILQDTAYESDYENLNEKIHSISVEARK